MKYIIVVGDGMADWPLEELNDKTPLEVADKPNMDLIAERGRCGLLKTIPSGMSPGSDVANLSLLGYNPKRYYTGGRGPLEAASAGIDLKEDEIAFRCNLITEENGILKDYSGGHISSREARELIKALNNRFANEFIKFYPGVSYRNLLILRSNGKFSLDITCTPPHDIMGERISEYLVKPNRNLGNETVNLLNNLILKSREILENHPVNVKRKKQNRLPANMVWFWSGGRKPDLPKFHKKFHLSGALISAVDLLKGIAHYIGLEVINVPGATAYLDTNFEGKAKYGLKSLEEKDIIYIHIEAPDEASHQGMIQEKIKAIENIDKRLISKILNSLNEEFTISLVTDHATPIEVRTHTKDPVPFAIYSPQRKGDSVKKYDENSAKKGIYGLRNGIEFMNLLLENG